MPQKVTIVPKNKIIKLEKCLSYVHLVLRTSSLFALKFFSLHQTLLCCLSPEKLYDRWPPSSHPHLSSPTLRLRTHTWHHRWLHTGLPLSTLFSSTLCALRAAPCGVRSAIRTFHPEWTSCHHSRVWLSLARIARLANTSEASLVFYILSRARRRPGLLGGIAAKTITGGSRGPNIEERAFP